MEPTRRQLARRTHRPAASTGMCGGLLVAAALAGAGCDPDQLIPAVGPNADITVFTSLTRDDPVMETFVAAFEHDVMTTRTESAFHVELVPPSAFSDRNDFKNVMIVTDMTDAAAVALARRVAGDAVLAEFESGARPFAIYDDVYGLGQTFMILLAPTREALARNVERYADALVDSLEVHVRRGLLESMYLTGDNPLLAHYVSQRAWTLRVPRGWEVEQDPGRNLVLAHSSSPERWLFVQHVTLSPEEFGREAVERLRRDEPRLYEDEEIVELEWTDTTFAGRPALELRGRWQTPSFVVGGPFRLYAVHDGHDRMYVVDYLVFLPSLDKNPYLRQLDAVASTFALKSDSP